MQQRNRKRSHLAGPFVWARRARERRDRREEIDELEQDGRPPAGALRLPGRAHEQRHARRELEGVELAEVVVLA